mmetsp:Transcript_19964/g.27446  ORF Transcript_19964/g.27446 Transcript_19964/m.27446 type:complete len:151 (-) Transcript_19964:664-1116(-)
MEGELLDEVLSSIFFNLYIYSSVVISDTFNEDLKSQCQSLDSTIEGGKELLPETKVVSNKVIKQRKELCIRKKEAIERTMRYVQRFGEDHINILNRPWTSDCCRPSFPSRRCGGGGYHGLSCFRLIIDCLAFYHSYRILAYNLFKLKLCA